MSASQSQREPAQTNERNLPNENLNISGKKTSKAWEKRQIQRQKLNSIKTREREMKREKEDEFQRKRQIRREREQKAAEKLRLEQMAAKVCSWW